MHARIAVALLVVSSVAAEATLCSSEPLVLYRNQEFRLRLVLHDTPARAIEVKLYKSDRLQRRLQTDENGSTMFGLLPVGRYRVVVPGWGTLSLWVRPEQ